jgi:hypothetical protein
MSGARLPGAASATATAEKVRDYLLSRDHSDNDGKADFFIRFGFTRGRWSELYSAIMAHPVNNEVVRAVPSGDGMRYRVRCKLTSPDGRDPCITTIWAVESGQPPRLITAFPSPLPLSAP